MKTKPPPFNIVQAGGDVVCLFQPTGRSIPSQVGELAAAAEAELGREAFAAIEKHSQNGLAAIPNLTAALAFEMGRRHATGRSSKTTATAGSGEAPAGGSTPDRQPKKTRQEIRAQFEGLTDPQAKSEFYRVHRQDLL